MQRSEMEEKVIIQQLKEKRERTYIRNLDKFFDSKENYEKFCKLLKKKLATGAVTGEDSGINYVSFQGYHGKDIVSYLLRENIVPEKCIAFN